MKTQSATLIWLVLLVATAGQAATLDFPDLGLSSTADDARTWAREHQFEPAAPTSPYGESYRHEFTGGMPLTHVLSFAASEQGLKILAFDQLNILEPPALLRRKIVQRFGTPSADQVLQDKTLRITFPYPYREPARRIFLVGPRQLSMLLVTDAFFAQLKGETDKAEQAQREAQEKAEIAAKSSARNAWLIPLLWVVGIGLGATVLLRALPRKARAVVLRGLEGLLGGLFGFVRDVFDQLFPIALGIVLLAMMILSALAVGSGALEWGTSWWWGFAWLAGVAMVYKAHDEGSLRAALLALLMFGVALFGVFVQQSWPLF
jgi:hypothetical protein